ncbi:MAG: preprotein translocase subunit YajC [Elusimicrobiota bacterium]
MIGTAYAMGQAPQGGSGGSVLGGLLPLIFIFVIFYFLLIRPQKKQMQKHKEMINSLKKNDEVITSGGIHGKITSLKGKNLELQIAKGVKILVSKDSVSAKKKDEMLQQQQQQK